MDPYKLEGFKMVLRCPQMFRGSISDLRDPYKLEGTSIQRHQQGSQRINKGPKGSIGVHKCSDGSLSPGRIPHDQDGSQRILRCSQMSLSIEMVPEDPKGSTMVLRGPQVS